jgi:hypothetical protein
VRSWSREKLAAVKAEGRRIESDLAGVMDRGPQDARVQELVGQYEEIRPGFAGFLRDAMAVYAESLKART